MSVMHAARQVMDEVHISGSLLRYEPIPEMGPPWEGPAQWRLGVASWEAVKREAEEIAGLYSVVADTAAVRLFGYPVVVDRAAPPWFLTLEPVPVSA